MSEIYNRPNHVTYHAFEILDKIIAICDQPKNMNHFFKLISLVCFLMACKMDGNFPTYNDVARTYNVTRKDLVAFERWTLRILDWNIGSCYSFMHLHRQIPEHMLTSFDKLIFKSYEMNLLSRYSIDVITEALISSLPDNDFCFPSNIRKYDNIDEKHLCELELQNTTPPLHSALPSHSPAYSPVEEYVSKKQKSKKQKIM